jgi:hypothetical protein
MAILPQVTLLLLVNQRGQSLIQVIISLGIMGIGMLAVVSMQVTQQRESRALTEKLASVDLLRVVTTALANPASCNAMFSSANLHNPAALPFDATAISPTTPYKFSITSIPTGTTAPPIVSAGSQVSPLSDSLVLRPNTPNPTLPPGIRLMVTSLTNATLELNFENSSLVRTLKPLQFPIDIITSGPLSSTLITSCGIANPNAWTSMNLYGSNLGPPAVCPAGWTEAGIGAEAALDFFGGTYAMVRTCIINQNHAVAYIYGSNLGPPAICPAGWTEAGIGAEAALDFFGGTYAMVRTCLK